METRRLRERTRVGSAVVAPFRGGCEVGRTKEERVKANRSLQTSVRVKLIIIQRAYERTSVRGSNNDRTCRVEDECQAPSSQGSKQAHDETI